MMVSMVSRANAISPMQPIDVSPSRLRHLSPTFRDVHNLQPEHSVIRKSVFLEESEKKDGGSTEDALSMILQRLSWMESKHDKEVKKLEGKMKELEEGNRSLGGRVEELEEEQIAFFLRDVIDKWLSAIGRQKLMKFLSIDDLKKNIRDIQFFREKMVMDGGCKQGGGGKQGIQVKLKEVENKLVLWRKAVNAEKVLGFFEINEVSGARQLELLLTSYMQVNEKAHTSMASVRWTKMETKVLKRVEAGKMKIEGVDVGGMVKIMLKELKGCSQAIEFMCKWIEHTQVQGIEITTSTQ